MKHRFTVASAVVALAVTGCGGGGGESTTTSTTPPTASSPAPAPAPATPKDVTIQFVAVAGPANTKVACNTPIPNLGSVPTTASLTDLRVYLTDIRLVDTSGASVPVTLTPNTWQYINGNDSVVLIDLEDGQSACGAEGTLETNAVIRGTVPAGTYTGFRATVGVPQRLSHSDVMASSAPLDLMAMGWSWQAGRKFVKVELNPTGGVTTPGTLGATTVSTWNLHLASTDCTGPNDGTATCAKRNLAQISLPLDTTTQQIAIDLAEMFATTDIRTNRNDAVGCMSATTDLDCTSIFAKFGIDLATSTATATPQSVFRTIAK